MTTSATKPSSSKVHPSILALMGEAHPGEKPADIMRRKCREMVDRARCLDWTGPPFDPEILAGLNDIIVEETDSPMDGEGSLFVRRGKVVIQYLRGIVRERQRFTICHELAHTCFPDAFEFVRRRLKVDEEAHRKFEHLCDIGAGELLMPHEHFSDRLKTSFPDLRLLQALAQDFIVSPDATAKRLIDLTPHSCAAVFLTDGAFDSYRAWENRNRVVWMWKSESFKGYFPRGTLLPAFSICNKSTESNANGTSFERETWFVNTKPRTVYVQTMQLPLVPVQAGYPKVLCLVHTRKPSL